MSLVAISTDCDLDFNIGQVAELLGIKVRKHTLSGADVDCPFCGHARKMNLNVGKNVYHCNYCGKGGGMLDLYRDVRNLSSRKEALREIREALGTGALPKYDWKAAAVKCRQVQERSSQLAPAEEIDRTYRALLGLLGLRSTHLQNLIGRGLTVEQVERYQFRSTPDRGAWDLAPALLRQGCTLSGVPGFYTDSKGIWRLHLPPNMAGILVPVLSCDGLISGFQIRLDRPVDKRKYVWLSSVNMAGGVSSGSPPHLVGDPHAKVVYITEGALKGYIAHELLGKTFGCIAGVAQYASLRQLLGVLKDNGTETICEAYDADKRTNPNVGLAQSKMFQIAREEYGFQVYTVTWNSRFKGIDDWALARKQQKI